MSVEKKPFGKLPDGREASLFKLTNSNGLVLELTDYGARIVAMYAPDRNGLMANVTLGLGSAGEYVTHHGSFGGTTGRFANRIHAGKFTLDGKTYQLAKNNGNNHLHGGDEGFNKKLWNAEIVANSQVPMVRFTYVSPDGEESYPGTLSMTVDYTLTDTNEVRIDYVATTDKPTVLNLTNHAYWNMAGAGAGDILKHEVTIAADSYVEVDAESIPTGKISSVTGTPMDFRDMHTPGERIAQMKPEVGPTGYDHCWILGSPGKLKFASRVRDPGSGRVLEVHTTEPGVQFYTGNYLAGTVLNGGFNQYGGLCLEAQHYPDSPNQSSFPSTVLRPGETYRQTTVHKFSVQ